MTSYGAIAVGLGTAVPADVESALTGVLDGRTFELAVDLSLVGGPFGREVLRVTSEIPYGGVLSYREVATDAGSWLSSALEPGPNRAARWHPSAL